MDKLRIILPEQVDSILAAVSGGADSVALLALLKEAADEKGVRLSAAHFEHGIRAEDSLADAAFVRDLCARWHIPLLEGSADVPSLARERKMGIEQAAREARYAFLKEAMRQVGAQVIALGHHCDDQAETVMMHLFRGAGIQGATGMQEMEGELYRPLLKVPKATLVSYLVKEGIPWREDATNQETNTPRNGIRLRVIPEIERFYPGVKRTVCRFAEIASIENDYMSQETDRILKGRSVFFPGGCLLSVDDGTAIHLAILMRAIHRLTSLPYEGVRRAAELAYQSSGREELAQGWFAERGAKGLYLFDGSWKGLSGKKIPPEGVVELDGLGRLNVEKGQGTPIRKDAYCQELDMNALQDAQIRTRRPGDTIRPLGAPGRQKLKEYFINRHVDRAIRDYIPLLAKGRNVLWVMGLGISEEAKLKEDSIPVRLSLTGWPLQKNGGSDNA